MTETNIDDVINKFYLKIVLPDDITGEVTIIPPPTGYQPPPLERSPYPDVPLCSNIGPDEYYLFGCLDKNGRIIRTIYDKPQSDNMRVFQKGLYSYRGN